MRILGIDPGSTVTGYGIVGYTSGRLSLVEAGALRLPRGGALTARIRAAADGIRDLLADQRPDEACIESIFQHVNVRSALVLAHVRGALMLEMTRSCGAVHEYTALQVKKAVAGHGHAGKDQVKAMVQRLLGLGALPGPHDLSDALAVAICHAHSSVALRRRGRS